MTDSGLVARVAGDAIGADTFLPNMGTDDFLKCLSKAAMERAASALNVLPRATGKATRAAVVEHVGTSTYILPAARFALSPAEIARLSTDATPGSSSGDIDEDGEDPAGDGDEDLEGEGADGEVGEDDEAMPPPSQAGEPDTLAA